MNRLVLAACTVLAFGCGAKRVPPAMLEKLPYESRIELLEAENELAVSIDHVDEAHAEILRTREALRRAKDRVKAADDEIDAADDAVSKDVAKLALTEAEARVGYLRAKQDVNVESEEVEAYALKCAYARFELARVKVARKAKVEGAESLSPETFEGQVKACEEGLAKRVEKRKEQETEATTARESWEKEKEELAKKTFDARASPYVE